MPRPITDDEHERIVAAIRAGKPRNEIAREVGRSPGTVTNIARAAGLTFDRSQTKTASRARAVDLAARRQALQARYLDEVEAQLDKLHRPVVEWKIVVVSDGVATGSHAEVVGIELDEPSEADVQRIMTSAGIATDKALALDRHDNRGESGADEVTSWVRAMGGGRLEGPL